MALGGLWMRRLGHEAVAMGSVLAFAPFLWLVGLTMPAMSYVATWPMLLAVVPLAWIVWGPEGVAHASWGRVAVLAVGASAALLLLPATLYQEVAILHRFEGAAGLPVLGLVSLFAAPTVLLLLQQVDFLVGPNWNLTWKNSLITNLAVTYGQSDWEEATETFWKKSYSVNLDLKYDFERSEGFSVPLPWLSSKKIKFTSKLSTGFNMGYSSASSFNAPASTIITMSPRATYRFSNRITGSVTGTYSRTAGGVLGYVYHRVGLHVQTEFTF